MSRVVKDGLCQAVASQLCQLLFTDAQDQTQLEVETLVVLLRKITELSTNTRQDVVMWLAGPRDDEVRSPNDLSFLVLIALSVSLMPQSRLCF